MKTEKGTAVWDRLSNKYDAIWVQKYSLEPTRREVLRRVQALSPQSVLDIGCGTGQLLGEISSATGARCVGIDKSAGMIQKAREKSLDAAFFALDICAPDMGAHLKPTFDVICCTHSFPYYAEKPLVLRRIYDLMHGDSVAVFVQASVNNLYDKLMMALVEKTAEKAEYLSRAAFLQLTGELFEPLEGFTIREKPFMPSICGFVLGKRREDYGYTPNQAAPAP